MMVVNLVVLAVNGMADTAVLVVNITDLFLTQINIVGSDGCAVMEDTDASINDLHIQLNVVCAICTFNWLK